MINTSLKTLKLTLFVKDYSPSTVKTLELKNTRYINNKLAKTTEFYELIQIYTKQGD